MPERSADRPALPRLGAWVGQLWGMPADEVRQAARELEDAGYGAIWISEAYGREAMSASAMVLGATRSIVVATGIANMFARDPMAMANGARTLAEAWPGRVVLGVGVSHQPLVQRRGHAYEQPLAMAEGYLRAMRETAYRAPAPAAEPPVLVGALGDRMLALGAELADGVHPYLVTPAHTRRAREVVGDALVAPEQAVVLATDPEVARAAARTHLATYLQLDNYVRSLRRQGFDDDDLADGGSDRLVDGIVAWGGVEQVVERAVAHLEAGADHVAVQPLAGEGVADPVAQLVELAPALRAAVA